MFFQVIVLGGIIFSLGFKDCIYVKNHRLRREAQSQSGAVDHRFERGTRLPRSQGHIHLAINIIIKKITAAHQRQNLVGGHVNRYQTSVSGAITLLISFSLSRHRGLS